MDRTTRRVTLELHTDEGPPAGIAYDEDGTGREFSGWLGLICALDALLCVGGSQAHQTETEEDDVDHPAHHA